MDYPQAYKVIVDELNGALSKVDPAGVTKLIEAIESAKRIYVVGAGRSGLMVRTFAMRLMQMGLESYVTGETTVPPIGPGDLIVVGSASGETGGPISMVRIAKSPKVKIAAVTVFADSTLGKLADIIVTIPAPTPKAKRSQTATSAQPMGSLFEQSLLALLDSVILMLMERKRLTSEEMFKKHAVME